MRWTSSMFYVNVSRVNKIFPYIIKKWYYRNYVEKEKFYILYYYLFSLNMKRQLLLLVSGLSDSV